MPVLATLLLLAQSAAPAPASGTLIVFRDHAEPLLFPATLTVDGVDVGRLKQKRLLAFAVPPGRYRLAVRWPALAMQRESRATVEVAAGGTLTVELRAASAFAGSRGGAGLVELEPGQAPDALRCCRPSDTSQSRFDSGSAKAYGSQQR